MNRTRGVLVLGILLLASQNLHGQTPVTTTRFWTGNFGAGLALTDGNTDTSTFNVSFAVTHDPKQRNVLKLNGLYLRGDKEGERIVDRTALAVRDEIALTPRVFFFVQNEYLRDRFKEISWLMSPTSGFGYKLVNTDQFILTLDSSLGGVWEKNIGRELSTNGAFNSSERIEWTISPNAKLTQSVTGLYELDSFSDALYNASLALAATITARTELKLEVLDSYKTRPPDPTIQKNDVAFVTSLLFKF
jgi:putative salt-induced outer membrane protein YdiY